MPELPEVETLRRSLYPKLIGQRISEVEVREPKIVSGNGQRRDVTEDKARKFEYSLTGERITDIERRAKQLILRLESGACVLIHLKMTGQLVYTEDTSSRPLWGGHPIELTENHIPHKHTHIIWTLESGMLVYNDVRKFGYVLYHENYQALENGGYFARLGVDPFDSAFTDVYFCNKLQKTQRTLKSALMDQEIVVGLGNIYVDETTHRARIDPRRAACSLSDEECQILRKNIFSVLNRAVELGGSSVANYILADGSRGTYAREHQVYNRAGKPCVTCGTVLEKTKITNRTTVYCPKCQT